MSHYNTYGKMASQSGIASITQNGRYYAQKDAEKYVPIDVIKKLEPNLQNSFLDIGCGLGLNLIPISARVDHAVGCDHPNVLKRLKQKSPNLNAELIGGNFLEIEFTQKYSKILAYSVLPSLPDLNVVKTFIDKTLSLLDPTGRALLGDLANIDKKKRFLKSKRGASFQREWEKLSSGYQKQDDISAFQEKCDKRTIIMDDKIIFDLIAHIREQGFHAFLLDQPQKLPFGNTREDILIVGSEYKDEK